MLMLSIVDADAEQRLMLMLSIFDADAEHVGCSSGACRVLKQSMSDAQVSQTAAELLRLLLL